MRSKIIIFLLVVLAGCSHSKCKDYTEKKFWLYSDSCNQYMREGMFYDSIQDTVSSRAAWSEFKRCYGALEAYYDINKHDQ